jgi:hypothetical protein
MFSAPALLMFTIAYIELLFFLSSIKLTFYNKLQKSFRACLFKLQLFKKLFQAFAVRKLAF